MPPPDCFSCFLMAVSNLYPGVYHTFPTPFSIGSHEHSDLRSQQYVHVFTTHTSQQPINRLCN